MSKNKLLIALTAGLFAATGATGAFAQTSSGGDAAGATSDNSAGAMAPKKHKSHKHPASANKKTPAAETGNNAGADSGQSK
ncbi:hypothetical protein CR51_33530 [Caballeronia megalochromosomata]|nr:hypothetical protein CR51_33530 [Caballeronia megalochromosomata]